MSKAHRLDWGQPLRKMRIPTWRTLALVAAPLILASLVGASCGGPLPLIESVRPMPAPVGEPLGGPQPISVDATGAGSLTTRDRRVTVAVPSGALHEGLRLSLQEVTNTAPQGIDSAYRLAADGVGSLPSASALRETIAVTFDVSRESRPISQLGIALQSETGFWVPVLTVLRNQQAKLVTAVSSDIGTFALVPTDPTRDLAGTFTVQSTLDVVLSATGSATLGYSGEDNSGRYYLLGGTTTLENASWGGVACVPDQATRAIPNNAVEVQFSPERLSWGTSGHWSVTCGEAAPMLAEYSFDTLGVSHWRCTRGTTIGAAAPVVSADQLAGDQTIDCSGSDQGGGHLRSTWNFVRCAGTCTSDNPCTIAAVVSCDSGLPLCANVASAPAGTACMAGSSAGVCNGLGACIECAAGSACLSLNPCAASAILNCSAGIPQCEDQALQPVGTPCSAGEIDGVCNSSGACVACTPGAACVSENPCAGSAVTECSTGAPVCSVQSWVPTGTQCVVGGVPGVCSSTGICTACTQGAACVSTDACAATATLECSSGAPVCTVRTYLAAGTVCGVGSVCNGTGHCTPCNGGAACSTGNVCVAAAAVNCSSGEPVCTPTAIRTDGTVCGGTATNPTVCLAGTCVTCQSGAPCTPTPVCNIGSLRCGRNAQCRDTGRSNCTPPLTCNAGTGLCN